MLVPSSAGTLPMAGVGQHSDPLLGSILAEARGVPLQRPRDPCLGGWMRHRSAEVARVGLVVPLQGPAGLFGPSCEAVAATAVRAINDAGVLGRELAVEVIDGGARPEQVGADVGRLIDAGRIDAVTGWHISAVRHPVG